MYPTVRGDGVAREGMQREIVAGDGDRELMFGFGGERLMKLSLLVV